MEGTHKGRIEDVLCSYEAKLRWWEYVWTGPSSSLYTFFQTRKSKELHLFNLFDVLTSQLCDGFSPHLSSPTILFPRVSTILKKTRCSGTSKKSPNAS